MYNLKTLDRKKSKKEIFTFGTIGGTALLGKVFGILVIISFVSAILTGNMEALSNSVSAGALRAIELVISLAGSKCLWNGCARVLD